MEETLEEVCDRIFLYQPGDMSKRIAKEKALDLAKWQAERMYSEEEVHEIILSYQNNVENSPNHITYNEWFEQFKKK